MLRQQMLMKKRAALEKRLNAARAKKKKLREDEESLQQQVDELEEITPELEQQVDELTAAQEQTDAEIDSILDEIEDVKTELAELGSEEPSEDPAAEPAAETAGRSRAAAPGRRAAAASGRFTCRSRCFDSRAQRDAFYARSDIRSFLDGVRSLAGSGRRAVTGAELNIPEVLLDLLRDNITQTSKLITKVRLNPVKGKARQNVTGTVPDGIWTEAIANLNELVFSFIQVEVDGFMVGGYIPVPNSYLQDSDISLGEEIMAVLLKAIGKGLDKAIIYGTGVKMPVGFVTRLAQTAQPAYWGNDQGDWTDLHTSNILKLNIFSSFGEQFFQVLLPSLAKAKTDYSDASTVWVMNHTTKMDLLARALNFNASGALVAGFEGRMPVEGGEIVELCWLPDYELAGGYLDLYLLAEREGAALAQSEHVFFLKNQTVFKGLARYDGQPVIGEGFVLINYANTDPTTSISFEPDYANTAMNVLICTAAAAGSVGKTVVTVAGVLSAQNDLYYALRFGGSVAVGDSLPAGFEELTSGSTAITAAVGAPITVVEVDGDNRVVSLGSVASVPKT